MKRLTNTLLAACIAGSMVFSSMSFLKAEEQVNLDDGLKNYWNFENVDVGATDIPSNDGKTRMQCWKDPALRSNSVMKSLERCCTLAMSTTAA